MNSASTITLSVALVFSALPGTGQELLEVNEPKAIDRASLGEIVDTLKNGDEVGKVLATMYLHLQPELKSERLIDPLLGALRRVREEDRPLVLKCVVGQGEPMLEHLIKELEGTPGEMVFRALAAFGTEAEPALRPLIPHARKSASPNHAVTALGAIGKAALPAALKMLRERHAGVRIQGLQIIEAIGPPASGAWSEVLRYELSPKKVEPLHGIRALGAMGSGARGAVKQLERWVRRKNQETARAALFALSRVDPTSRVALARFRRMIRLPIETDRVKAMADFRHLRFEPSLLKDLAERMLKDPNDTVRRAALEGLIESPLDATTKYRLAKPFENIAAKPRLRPAETYCQLMGACGPEGAQWLARYVVEVLAKSNATEVARLCLRQLRRMGTEARGALSSLKKARKAFPEDHMKEHISLTIFVVRNADWKSAE